MRFPAPLVSSPATMPPNPSLPGGSTTFPALNEREAERIGSRWFSTTSSRTPLGNTVSWNGGKGAGARGAASGGRVGYCCAASAGLSPVAASVAANQWRVTECFAA